MTWMEVKKCDTQVEKNRYMSFNPCDKGFIIQESILFQDDQHLAQDLSLSKEDPTSVHREANSFLP